MTSTETVDKLNKQIVDNMFEAVNYSNNGKRLAKLFVKHIETEHRTLVQSFFRTMAYIIEKYSLCKEYDDRNKDSLEWAKKVSSATFFMRLI